MFENKFVRAENVNFSSQGRSWAVPLFAFVVYSLLFLVGYLKSLSVLNAAGAVCFIAILIVGNYKHMFSIRRDITVSLASFLLAAAVVNALLGNITDNSTFVLIKYAAVLILYILSYSYNFSPMCSNNRRKFFVFILLFFITASFVIGDTYTGNDEYRVSGVFTNPNNFALICLSLLFFIDDSMSRRKTLAAYAFILTLLIVSSTSGAILAFFVALAYKNSSRVSRLEVVYILLVFAVLFLCFYSVFTSGLSSIDLKLYKQFLIIFENIGDLSTLEKTDYGQLSIQHGGASGLSGIWRVAHWSRLIFNFSNESLPVLLLGHGVGTTADLVGKSPHNEFVRILIEQGIFGFTAFITFFVVVFRRIHISYKYIFVVFAIFAVTENIIDNLLFMFLFILFIASSQVHNKNLLEVSHG